MVSTNLTTFLDDPAKWGAELNPPPSFDVLGYQEKLNQIAGLSRGKPIVKLFWGGNVTEKVWKEFANGIPTKFENEPLFHIKRPHPILLDYQKIPIRRWILTQRTEPEQYGYGDDSDNTVTDETGQTRLMGYKPKEFYTPYIFIGDHSICPKDCSERKRCYGDYKLPSQAELDLVAEHCYLARQDGFNVNPYQRITQPDIAKGESEIKSKLQAEKEKKNAELDLQSLDWFRTHGHRLRTDFPKGRFIFLGQNQTTKI